jgi:hypothetical protein
MNLRIQLPCWVAIGLIFSACATLETGGSGPDFALIKCPVSPAQASTAQIHANRYLAAVASGHRPPPRNRYVAVTTLSPNKKQTAAYVKKRQAAAADAAAKHETLPAKWAEPSQLKCVCIFDTQSRQFVGTVCYVISSEPAIGEIARFESMSAEFVGTGAEPPPASR